MKQQEKLFPLQRQVVTAQSKILSKKPGDKERSVLLVVVAPSGPTRMNVILRNITVNEDRTAIEEKIFKKIDKGQAIEREIGIARTKVTVHEKRFTIRPEDKRELLGMHFKDIKLQEVLLVENYNED